MLYINPNKNLLQIIVFKWVHSWCRGIFLIAFVFFLFFFTFINFVVELAHILILHHIYILRDKAYFDNIVK